MRTSIFARWPSRTSIVSVVSPSSVQNGVDASVLLTKTPEVDGSSVRGVAGALVPTEVLASTLYEEGTGTSDARYAGVEQAASNPANAVKNLRMTFTLSPHRQRRPPRMERFNVFR